jgi:DNA (cytosine-5)-methyltransferase 1
MAFELEGFAVVHGPDIIFGRDIRNFHPPAGRFDGVIGGPPCQAFSRLRHLVEHNGYAVAENLIPEFERCVREAEPLWFVMENVPAAPGPDVPLYIITRHVVTDAHVGGATSRMRAFHFGRHRHVWHGQLRRYRDIEIEWAALHTTEPEPTVCASGGTRPVPVAIGGSGKVKRSLTERHVATRKGASAMDFKTTGYLRDAIRNQGLPDDFLEDAPFTVAGKIKCVGNGVPLPMGRAIAQAVTRALA